MESADVLTFEQTVLNWHDKDVYATACVIAFSAIFWRPIETLRKRLVSATGSPTQ